MEIKGYFRKDDNFTYVYSGNIIYTIARNTGDWGCISVGDTTHMGIKVTQEYYNSCAANCTHEGTFELEED